MPRQERLEETAAGPWQLAEGPLVEACQQFLNGLIHQLGRSRWTIDALGLSAHHHGLSPEATFRPSELRSRRVDHDPCSGLHLDDGLTVFHRVSRKSPDLTAASPASTPHVAKSLGPEGLSGAGGVNCGSWDYGGVISQIGVTEALFLWLTGWSTTRRGKAGIGV